MQVSVPPGPARHGDDNWTPSGSSSRLAVPCLVCRWLTMGTMWSGLNEGIPLGLEATMWSSVYLYKRLDPRHERKTGREREVSRGSCDGSQEGCGGVTLLFPSFRQTAKWGTTHMFVSFPATSSGVSSTTQRHRAHHICKDPCSNLFFPWGDPSTRQAFPTPPLLDPTSLSPQRKAPGRIAGQDHKSRKGLIRRRERNIWLSKHISHEPKS